MATELDHTRVGAMELARADTLPEEIPIHIHDLDPQYQRQLKAFADLLTIAEQMVIWDSHKPENVEAISIACSLARKVTQELGTRERLEAPNDPS